MNESRSLSERLTDDLTADLSVSIAAVGLALVAFFLAPVGESVGNRFLLICTLGIFIPYAYGEYWPVEYSPTYAAVWTVSAGLVASGIFIGVFAVAQSALSSTAAGALAFVATVCVQYGIAMGFPRVR
ncbi:hypothetical protein [Halostagnicola kamekurae]|uniref:Uncharacterized protein n=1 Tax=Halostagnicola kamekurae TaxID=619731 RepID=A0A1I6P4L2_9EURY|nr:hypothetical protein [Halostagnicola kamekurae]SFS35030.1 hypothetical protein SAMN04488556_0314 [Halostagnicola kamekurae]